MEYGIQVGPSEFAQYCLIAQAAEALGFDLIAFPDHIVYEGFEGQYEPRTLAYDAMMIAAAVTLATKKIRVGHLVLCNLFRHPVIAAQSLMSLDHMSGGRAIVGLGTGWTESEFRMSGIPYPDPSTRLEILDESLTVMRSLWNNERTNFEGRHYHLQEAILWPKPIQKPHPPILLGGGGKGLLRIAAKHADYMNLVIENGRLGKTKVSEVAKLTEQRFVERLSFLRDETEKAGRPRDAVKISNMCFATIITDSPNQTRQTAQGIGLMLNMATETVLHSPISLIGTPGECIAEMKRRVKEWEVKQFIFTVTDATTPRRLAEEVIPHV